MTDTASKSSAGEQSGSGGGELRYPPQCSAEAHIRAQVRKPNWNRFVIMLSGRALNMVSVYEERATAYAGWYKRIKHWRGAGWLRSDCRIHSYFMKKPSVCSYEDVEYEDRPG